MTHLCCGVTSWKRDTPKQNQKPGASVAVIDHSTARAFELETLLRLLLSKHFQLQKLCSVTIFFMLIAVHSTFKKNLQYSVQYCSFLLQLS